MKGVRIEFRCMEDEKKRLYGMAERRGQKVGDYVLGSTINKGGRCGLDTMQRAAVQRMKTSLDKIGDGIGVQQETEKNRLSES